MTNKSFQNIPKLGLDEYSNSVKATLIKIASGMINLYVITDKDLKREQILEQQKNEIKSQYISLLKQYDKKEITPTTFSIKGAELNRQTNDCDLQLQQIKKLINMKKFKKKRIELIQKILAVDLTSPLSIIENCKIKYSLYSELSDEIFEEALTTINHDINIERLNKYSVSPVKEISNTPTQAGSLSRPSDRLYELRDKIDKIKKLQQTNSMGNLLTLKFDMLADDDITRIIEKVFPEDLYTNKKRTA